MYVYADKILYAERSRLSLSPALRRMRRLMPRGVVYPLDNHAYVLWCKWYAARSCTPHWALSITWPTSYKAEWE